MPPSPSRLCKRPRGPRPSFRRSVLTESPLHLAVELGKLQDVILLLKQKAKVDLRGINGQTPLHIAVENGFDQIAEVLLNHGASPNSEILSGTQKHFTPLHVAAMLGREKIVEMLISKSANVNAKAKNSVTPLHLAVAKEQVGCAKSLLNNGAKVNVLFNIGLTVLHIAVLRENLDLVSALLEFNADVKATTIHNISALHLSVFENSGSITKLLLEKGADVNARTNDGQTPLHFAVSHCRRNFEVAKGVLQRYSKFYWKVDRTENDFSKVIMVLKEAGANINAVNSLGETPVLSAIQNNYFTPDNFQFLLKCGVNVRGINILQKALFAAIENRRLQYVEILLTFGADVKFQDNDGHSVFHVATESNFPEIMDILLDWGADINAADNYRITPLHLGVFKGYHDCVRKLLECGADINITNNSNFTALDYGSACLNSRDINLDPTVVLKHQVIKMIAANMPVITKYRILLKRSIALQDFLLQCEKEISDMKSSMVGNSCISFYSILAKSTDELVRLLRNDSILQSLKCGDYRVRFPSYASMISPMFTRAERRKNLRDQGIIMFCKEIFSLPDICTEKIFDYLNNGEIITFLGSLCKHSNDTFA